MSADRRYFVDQNNTPFIMVGDSPHTLLGVSTADAATYFSARLTNGYNSLWVELMLTPYINGPADWSLSDGTKPFTGTIAGGEYDITKPNSNYFAHVDLILNMAATNGMQLLLDTVETGGGLNTVVDNGNAACYSYGQYLGNRYKNFTNILWITGNDYGATTPGNAALSNVISGILSNDTNHLHTVQFLNDVVLSSFGGYFTNALGANGIYFYSPIYTWALTAWNLSTHWPVYVQESLYENEASGGNPTGTPNTTRRSGYWAVLYGALAGYMSGVFPVEYMSSDSGWTAQLATGGATSMKHFGEFFNSIAWYTLIPDQTPHRLVTSGLGTSTATGTIAANDYLTAAYTANGTLAVAYVPTSRTFTVQMTNFVGPVTARWWDPTTNAFTAITGSPFANTISTNLTTPGNNAAGDGDWVLLLESSATSSPVWSATSANIETLSFK